jgi:hypothetical protein
MDFHSLNLISNGKSITGIIDWTGAAAGDPRADLARTEITILVAPLPPGPLTPLLKFMRRIFLKAWRSGYREVSGFIPIIDLLGLGLVPLFLAEMEFLLEDIWAKEKDIERLCNSLQGLIDIFK